MGKYEKYMSYTDEKKQARAPFRFENAADEDALIPAYDSHFSSAPYGMFDMHGSLDLITGKNANHFFSIFKDEDDVNGICENLDYLIALEDVFKGAKKQGNNTVD